MLLYGLRSAVHLATRLSSVSAYGRPLPLLQGLKTTILPYFQGVNQALAQ
jgi:hypothetical protein